MSYHQIYNYQFTDVVQSLAHLCNAQENIMEHHIYGIGLDG